MTRYFYYTKLNEEMKTTRHYGTFEEIVYVLNTAKHEPMAIKLKDTNEDDLLFFTKESCEQYYK